MQLQLTLYREKGEVLGCGDSDHTTHGHGVDRGLQGECCKSGKWVRALLGRTASVCLYDHHKPFMECMQTLAP